MSKFTKFLGSVVGGVFDSPGDMRDYQHAQRLFTDNVMALAPKVEFLYHVYFDINENAVRNPGQYGFGKAEPNIEVGMLVKQANLPGVQVNTQTKNQYGKKTNIQTSIDYQPVQLTFHDDNTGLIYGLWQQYFKSYYADSQFAEELRRQPTYNSGGSSSGDANADNQSLLDPAQQQGIIKFGFDNWKSVRFFNSIKIYQLSRKTFFEFELINPIVTQWVPPNLDASSSQPAQNQMTVIYEGINYTQGRVSQDQPDGFAQLHYDNTPSPLQIGGGLLGPGGVIAGGLDVFGDLLDPNVVTDPFALLGTAIKAKNTYDNARNLSTEGVRNEFIGAAERAILNGANNVVRVSGGDKTDQTRATTATQPPPPPANTKDIQAEATNQPTTPSATVVPEI